MQMYFQAVEEEAVFRAEGIIPDLQTYIDIRRDTSGCKPVFDLIEYSLGLELPDSVIDHPVIMALNQGANDLVTWSNVSAVASIFPTYLTTRVQDIFSYNVEQARGDSHNMICVFMFHDGLTVQQAMDRVGDMCKYTIDTFSENQARIPSWGGDVDRDAKLYVDGLKAWIAGSLHWSFMTKRYFGDNGALAKATRIIELFPQDAVKA
jgi:alpha-muurolene/germacrene-A/gamma-muurolene synthase